jgi:hypothetical protein
MRSPCCLSVCLCHKITFDATGIFHEILQGGHAIEGDLHATHSNPVASTVPKWWMLKLLTWTEDLYQLAWEHEYLMSISPEMLLQIC